MIRKLSAIITFFALLFFITPLVNILMLPADLFSSAILLFGCWFGLIITAFLTSNQSARDAAISPEPTSANPNLTGPDRK
ncbi:MAG: hypothetical protein ACON4G_08810 [Candidatus Puniceispirillaceae bacterium]